MNMLWSLFQGLKAEISWFFSALTYASAAADVPVPADSPPDTPQATADDAQAREHASHDDIVAPAKLAASHSDDAQPHSAAPSADVGDFLHHVKPDTSIDGDTAPQGENGGQLLASASLTDVSATHDSLSKTLDALSQLDSAHNETATQSVTPHKADAHDDIGFSAAPLYGSDLADIDSGAVISFSRGHGGGGHGVGGGTGFDEIVGPANGLKFHLYFDQAASSLPTGFQADVEAVANFLSTHFNDNITVNIRVGYGEVGGFRVPASALGESITNMVTVGSYSAMRSDLLNDTATGATGDDGRTMLSAMTTDPTNGGNFVVSSAEAKALGIATSYSMDGSIGFSSFKNIWAYDSSNVGSGQFDFYSVVAHELTEVMGRTLFVGESANGTPNSYDPLDLFHFASATGAHTFVGNVDGYFSLDGTQPGLHKFNSSPNGDFGDWASGQGVDSFDAFGGQGQRAPIGPFDLPVMDAIGWDRIA